MERALSSLCGEALPPAADSGSQTAALSLGVVSDRRGLYALADEWDALFRECAGAATLFQTHQWARHYVDRIATDVSIRILTARKNGRLVAIAPLMVDRSFGLPALRWLGGSLTIYGDVLASPDIDVGAWLSVAFDELAGSFNCVFFENVRESALVTPFLLGKSRELGRQRAPILKMDRFAGFGAWQASLSTNTRRGRKRRFKHLETAGHISFEYEAGGPAARSRVSDLFALKRAWAKSRGVVSRTIEDRSFEALVTDLVCGEAGRDCRVSSLLLDGFPIAVELGLVTGSRYLSYVGAYDPAYSAYSPGTLQLERTLEACFDEGITTFDLLPPNDEYKAQWANSSELVVNHAVPFTALGTVQVIAARVDPIGLAKEGLRRTPKPVRHVMHSVAAKWVRAREAKVSWPRLKSWSGPEWSLLALACAACAIIAD